MLKFIIKEIIYTGHLQALGATSVSLLASSYLGVPLFPKPLILGISFYLLFQAIYYTDRILDLKKDVLTNGERVAHLSSKGRLYRILPLIFFIIFSLITYYYFSFKLTLLFSLLLLLGVFYPLFLKSLTKYVPLFKNIYVSLFYASVPLISLVSFSEYDPNIWNLAFFVFVNIFTMQIILDLKDIESDSKEGLKTLPVLLGFNSTVKTALVILSLFSLYFLIYSPLNILMLFFNAFVIGYSLYLLNKDSKWGYILMASLPLLWLPVILV